MVVIDNWIAELLCVLIVSLFLSGSSGDGASKAGKKTTSGSPVDKPGSSPSTPKASRTNGAGILAATAIPESPKKKPKHFPSRIKGNIQSWDVPGGTLKFDLKQNVLSAHCGVDCHQEEQNECRCRRTLSARLGSTSSAQGRPVGFLMAWLQDQHRHPDGLSHGNLGRRGRPQSSDDRAAMTKQIRMAARYLLDPEHPVFRLERDRWPGEDDEPDECP